MKKVRVISVVAALLFFGLIANAQAADLKIGLGCQGMYIGPLVQGASARVWSGPIGGEVDIFTGHAKAEISPDDPTEDSSTMKANLDAIGLKGMYALKENKNSKFYAGAKLMYGKAKIKEAELGDFDAKGTIWTLCPMMGCEFNWQETPEIGINLEVGYLFDKANFDDEDGDMDLDIDGINVSLGVHYYF